MRYALRGGSKGIQKKIKLINKKPLISYTLDSAHKSEIFDNVVVSADSLEIADVARKYGGVPFMRQMN